MIMAAGGLGNEKTEGTSNASNVAVRTPHVTRHTRHSNDIFSGNPGDVDRCG
jgi:hypothetical protein